MALLQEKYKHIKGRGPENENFMNINDHFQNAKDIINENIFNKCGLFIESTRAGEDADFMSRAKLHNLNICESDSFLNYDKLDKISTKDIIKKRIQ